MNEVRVVISSLLYIISSFDLDSIRYRAIGEERNIANITRLYQKSYKNASKARAETDPALSAYIIEKVFIDPVLKLPLFREKGFRKALLGTIGALLKEKKVQKQGLIITIIEDEPIGFEVIYDVILKLLSKHPQEWPGQQELFPPKFRIQAI